MSRIFAIAAKDLRSTFRNLPALTMMLAAPLALSALLGLAFGGAGGFSITAAKVTLANLDRSTAAAPAEHGGTAGDLVAGVLQAPDLKDVLAVNTAATAEAARQKVDDGEAAVAVVIPADFSRVVYGASAETTEVELYRNPTHSVGGAVTESVVSQALLVFNGARAAAAAAQGLAVADGREAGEVAAAAQRGVATFVRDAERGSAGLALDQRPPQLADGEKSEDVGIIGGVLAGMMVLFMLFGASGVAQTILTEDQDGTLARLFTTPSPRRVIIGGKFVSTFATVLAQGILLVIGGSCSSASTGVHLPRRRSSC